jgi:hypothetical protein
MKRAVRPSRDRSRRQRDKKKSMRTVPCLLALVAIWATSCHAPAHAPGAKAAAAPSAPIASKRPPRTSYTEEDIAKSPLARIARGEPVRESVEFICVPTGNFNLSPTSDDELLFQMGCAERNPVGNAVATAMVNDSVAPRFPGKHVFKVLFENSTVSVQELGGGKRQVRLHYLDAGGTFHHTTLPKQEGKEYSYSFASLTPEVVVPIGEARVLEIER